MLQFFYAAHKYNCKEALNMVKDYMRTSVDEKSAVIYYETAKLYEFPDVKLACEKVVFSPFLNGFSCSR